MQQAPELRSADAWGLRHEHVPVVVLTLRCQVSGRAATRLPLIQRVTLVFGVACLGFELHASLTPCPSGWLVPEPAAKRTHVPTGIRVTAQLASLSALLSVKKVHAR